MARRPVTPAPVRPTPSYDGITEGDGVTISNGPESIRGYVVAVIDDGDGNPLITIEVTEDGYEDDEADEA